MWWDLCHVSEIRHSQKSQNWEHIFLSSHRRNLCILWGNEKLFDFFKDFTDVPKKIVLSLRVSPIQSPKPRSLFRQYDTRLDLKVILESGHNIGSFLVFSEICLDLDSISRSTLSRSWSNGPQNPWLTRSPWCYIANYAPGWWTSFRILYIR